MESDRRPLRWRRIPKKSLTLSRRNLITLFGPSPDPYINVRLDLPAEALSQRVAAARERSGKPITLTMAAMRLLAAAVAQHPRFNRLVLGGEVYELDDISFTLPFLIPGSTGELANLIVRNPHTKSLVELQDEFEAGRRADRTKDLEARRRTIGLVSFLIRSGLYRVIGEKRAYRVMHERGIGTNLVLTNATARGVGRIVLTKSGVQILRVFTRFYLHAAQDVPVVEDGQVVVRRIIPLTIAFDHRLVDGVHLHAFTETLATLAASPSRPGVRTS